jgi:hypothetical protein
MFMNTSARVWEALRGAILQAGFEIRQVDSFDKQHATFKQLVSENAAGEDLVIHCFKPADGLSVEPTLNATAPFESVKAFLRTIDPARRVVVYLHVGRGQEIDMRQLYSEWMAMAVKDGIAPLGFAQFRSVVQEHLRGEQHTGEQADATRSEPDAK